MRVDRKMIRLSQGRTRAAPLRRTMRNNLEGYLLISPWLVGLFLFTIGPVIASLGMSLADWDIIGKASFVGLDNYHRILTSDRLFRQAVYNTVYYTLLSVPLRLLLALCLASLINRAVWGAQFWTTGFYLASMFSVVAMGVLWRWILASNVGVFNHLLSLVGIVGPEWRGDPAWTKPGLVLVSLMYVGPQIVIFLAGLKGRPEQLYEAAELDGAGQATRFFNVTLPMLSPVLFFNMVTAVIHAFQVFAIVFVMFSGGSIGSHGPMNSTLVYIQYLYEKAFRQLSMGYAAALAWLLFVVVLLITLLQLRFSSWVYYERGAQR